MSMDLIDIAMAAAIKKGGGGGGTTDYTDLSNKPSINGNQLVGNKSSAALGITWSGTAEEWEQVKGTLPAGTFWAITDDLDIDLVPTQGSSNPVTSNGVFQELKKLKVINENPENHNGIYRGKNLTNVYTIEQIYERVHDGSFEDLYLGDYFTVHLTTDLYTRFTDSSFVAGTTYYEMDNGTDVTQRTWTETQDETPQEGKVYATKQVVEEDVDYMIAGFDLYIHRGRYIEDFVKDHHIVLVLKQKYKTNAKYHHDATAMQGYALSDIFNITLPCYAKSTKTALNEHIIARMSRRTTTVDPNAPSSVGSGLSGTTTGMSWVASELDLLSCEQMTGTNALSSSWRDAAAEPYTLPIYNFIRPQELSIELYSIWLSNVAFVTNGKVYAAAIQDSSILNVASVDAYAPIRTYFLFG